MNKRVQGTVRSRQRRLPLADLVVEVYALPECAGSGSAALAGAERIGSARTGKDGRFVIEFEECVAAADAPPRRFVTAVYSDDNDVGDGAPIPLAVTRPRVEPAPMDDLVIRVPEDVLAAGGVAPPGPVVAPVPSLGALAASALQVRQSAKRSVQQATAGELRRRLDLRRRGRDLARRVLTPKRARARQGASPFVAPGQSPQVMLDRARAAGVERLQSMTLPGVQLRLDESLLQSLFPQSWDGQPITLTSAQLDLVQPYVPSGSGTSRLYDLLTTCRAELAAQRAASANGAALPHDHTIAPEQQVLPRSDLQGRASSMQYELARQLRALITGEGAISITPRPDLSAIGEDLGAELPAGPADTTAYYDFQRLQIAWENTWTAVLDDLTVQQVTDLYESFVDTVTPEDGEIDDSEIEELDDLLQSVADSIAVATGTPGTPAPADLVTWLPMVAGVWGSLSYDDQEWIRFWNWVDGFYPVISEFREMDAANDDTSRGNSLSDYFIISSYWQQDWQDSVSVADLYAGWGADQAEALIEGLDLDAEVVPPSGLTRLEGLLGGINARLAEQYSFDIFVPDSYNYGILTTYRQRWQPLSYQAGDLVASMPLAPGETRSFETKRIVKTTRAQKEIEKSLAARTGESTTTGRVEAEIVQKATNATNFAMSTEGAVHILMADFSGTGSFGANQASDSAQTKRDLREATEKAAQEYRDERTLEVSTEESTTGETVEKRSITNPNNELTVTYLLYELQRRFEVSERLNEITPVVMVAFEVPSPDEIDEAWLLEHSWILRRVLLDDRLRGAIDYLADAFAGDELGVELRRVTFDAQMEAMALLRDNVGATARTRDIARAALKAATETVAETSDGGALGDPAQMLIPGGVIRTLGEALFPSGADQAEVITAQREAAQRALEWADQDLTSTRSRLEAGVNALRQATDDYVEAVQRRTNRRVAIDQLRLHVKQNILHYMQAIWSHEPPDQRYFRLYDLPIQWPETDRAAYTLAPATTVATFPIAGTRLPYAGSVPATGGASSPGLSATPPSMPNSVPYVNAQLFVPGPTLGPERALHEVADLDTLLGFKGNYAIFPLKEGNAFTEYMSQAFLDSYFGVIDPDPFGQIPTTKEALELAECAWNNPDTTDEDRAEITAWLTAVMANQERVAEEIVVPTGQLFIEALPGAHPLLEDFKLQHRAMDLERATVDVKIQQVELLRRAARLAAGDLSDADLAQRIEVSGATPVVSIAAPPTTTP